jgi:hypothetical protein
VFAAGQILTAGDLNAVTTAVESGANTTPGTTTSTTFTDTLTGSSTVTLAFTAPASGVIVVTVSAECSNSGGSNYTIAGFRISGAAGTVAATDTNSIYLRGTDSLRASGEFRVGGLTPGMSGTVTMQHRVNPAGTGTFNNRELLMKGAN